MQKEYKEMAKKAGTRFANITNAAIRMKKDISTVSRALDSNKIKGGTYPVYVQDGGEFFEVEGASVKAVDMEGLE